MTKLLALALAAGLALPTAALHAQPEITAADIARHLGIHYWKIPKEKLPGRFAVGLMEIKNGREVVNPLGVFAIAKPGDLTVTIHLNVDGTYAATLAVGSDSLSINPDPKRKLLPSAGAARCGWSDVEVDQPMVLMGEFKVVDGAMRITRKVEDVISGFALTIMSTKDDGAQEQASTADAKRNSHKIPLCSNLSLLL